MRPLRTKPNGNLIRRARLEMGLTQRQLSERTGIPEPTISKLENNHRRPQLYTLQMLARVLPIDVSEYESGVR